MSLTSGTRTVGIALRGDDTSMRQMLQNSAAAIQQWTGKANQSLAAAGRMAQDSSQKIGTAAGQSATATQQSSEKITRASQQASAGMRSTAKEAQTMGSQVSAAFGSLTGSLTKIAGVAGLGYIAKQIASVGIGFNDFTQKAEISLEVLLGSADKARVFLSDMLAFAKQTPFALPDLTESAQKLLAFGVDGEQVIPILRGIGDAATAAGKGTAGVQQLALVLGQIQAKGRLQGDEILQLAENGVNALTILANQANMTTADFQKEVTAGNVSAEQAINGLIDGIENGTNGINGATASMGGLMDRIKGSGGWTATLDSARSAFRNAAGAVTENLLPSLISLLRTGTEALGFVQDMAEGFGELPEPLRNAALAATAFLIANRLMGNQLRELTFGQLVPFRQAIRQSQEDLVRLSAASGDRGLFGSIGAGLASATSTGMRPFRSATTAAIGAVGALKSSMASAASGGLVPFRSALVASRTELESVSGLVTNKQVAFNALRGSLTAAGTSARQFGTNLVSATTASTLAMTPFRASWVAARAQLDAAGGSATRTQTALLAARTSLSGMGSSLRRLDVSALNGVRSAGVAVRASLASAATTAKSLGSSVLGAFGGPVGIAITGVVAAVAAFATAQSEANARAKELKETLDQQTGAMTESTAAFVARQLTDAEEGKRSTAEIYANMGGDVNDLTRAVLGEADAQQRVNNILDDRSEKWLGIENNDGVDIIRNDVEGLAGALEKGQTQIQLYGDAVAGVGDQSTDTANSQLVLEQAYTRLSGAIAEATEEQQKALDSAADAARSAYDSATTIGKADLNTSTDDDLAAAQDKVTQSARRVRDAEASLAETRGRKKASTNDIVRAEEAVTDARKEASDAAAELTEVESRRDPVANYRKQMEEMLSTAQTFAANIQSLADQGLNAQTLQELINLGPEGSKETIDALLADSSLVGLTNDTQSQLNDIGGQIEQQSRVAQAAIENGGASIGTKLGLGMRIAAEEGTADTVQAIADKLGENPQAIYDAGRLLGLSFLDGLNDAANFQQPRTIRPDGSVWTGSGNNIGMANGGIFPGYTPGRDIGFIGISGGEAVMRPEWTRAVGPGWVHQMNALARSGGVSAVREAMAAYRGGYRNGGVVGASSTPAAPNVITVPVAVTNERHDPWTIQRAYFTDPRAAEGWGNRQRARRAMAGRR